MTEGKTMAPDVGPDGKAYYYGLLRRYIAHVQQCEGADFVEQIGGAGSEVQFSDGDVGVLRAVARAALEEWNPDKPAAKLPDDSFVSKAPFGVDLRTFEHAHRTLAAAAAPAPANTMPDRTVDDVLRLVRETLRDLVHAQNRDGVPGDALETQGVLAALAKWADESLPSHFHDAAVSKLKSWPLFGADE